MSGFRSFRRAGGPGSSRSPCCSRCSCCGLHGLCFGCVFRFGSCCPCCLLGLNLRSRRSCGPCFNHFLFGVVVVVLRGGLGAEGRIIEGKNPSSICCGVFLGLEFFFCFLIISFGEGGFLRIDFLLFINFRGRRKGKRRGRRGGRRGRGRGILSLLPSSGNKGNLFFPGIPPLARSLTGSGNRFHSVDLFNFFGGSGLGVAFRHSRRKGNRPLRPLGRSGTREGGKRRESCSFFVSLLLGWFLHNLRLHLKFHHHFRLWLRFLFGFWFWFGFGFLFWFWFWFWFLFGFLFWFWFLFWFLFGFLFFLNFWLCLHLNIFLCAHATSSSA